MSPIKSPNDSMEECLRAINTTATDICVTRFNLCAPAFVLEPDSVLLSVYSQRRMYRDECKCDREG